ncbi:LytR C-terminal domain-containing protein [Sinomonas halotolerans]|uniref:LytR C-terminal domain-containing protein n=1 Tax=Sinomonas halotolerans TaxID=1644133 RepID=A0ABU9WXU1_9MICC
MPRKPKDLTVYHGHRVVSGPDLRSQFEPDPDEAENVPRMRRRILHGAMIALLVAIVVFGAGAAWAILSGYIKLPEPATAPSLAACPSGTYDYLPPEQTTVNVLNAAGREGLARQVADELAKRRFRVLAVDNEKFSTAATAVVRSGSAGEAAAFTLQRHVPGSVFVRDPRADDSVDLLLGPAFTGLAAPKVVDQTPGTLNCELPSPTATPPVR